MGFDEFADGWPAKISQVGFGEESRSYLTLNLWKFPVLELGEAPFAVDAKMDAKRSAVVEVEKHLFADGPGFGELSFGDEFGA